MRSLGLTLLLASLLSAQQQSTKITRDVELKKSIAAGLVELSAWCHSKKLMAEGRPLAEEALGLDPDNARAKDLKTKLTGDSAATDADAKEFAKKLESYGKKIGAMYRELFGLKHQQPDQEKWDVYIIRAYAFDMKASGPILEGEWRIAYQNSDLPRAYRLLSGAEKISKDASREKVLKEVELRCSEKTPVLKTASTHPMEYYFSLPKGWSPAKKWPILVTVEGAGCNWLGNCNAFVETRKELPFIIVTPWTFCNTNALDKNKYHYPQSLLDEADRTGRLKFDEEGLLAVLDDVRRDFGGQDKFFITGFSGGGNLTWRMIFGHPDLLAAAAPACANFYTTGKISEAPERETLPVKAFQGDKDEYLNNPPNLEQQWQSTKKFCDDNGFKNVTREMVPGVGHSACCDLVLKFFSSQLKK